MKFFFKIYPSVFFLSLLLLQEGGPLTGPETGALSGGDTRADKVRDFIGEGPPGGEQEGEETQESCSVWLTVPGFMVTGSVSGWSLADHSNSECFLVAQASLSQDGC